MLKPNITINNSEWERHFISHQIAKSMSWWSIKPRYHKASIWNKNSAESECLWPRVTQLSQCRWNILQTFHQMFQLSWLLSSHTTAAETVNRLQNENTTQRNYYYVKKNLLMATKYWYILPKYWNTGEKIVPSSVVLGGVADSGHSSTVGLLATFTLVVPNVIELHGIHIMYQDSEDRNH